jgi:HD-like signal output (HDOD) protein
MQLDDLLARQFIFPSIPKVVALLVNELDREESDLKQINQLIGTDLALTARLLQLANSEFFSMCGKISSVSQALALLNLAQVRTMAHEAVASASLKAVPAIHMSQFWEYSLNVAKVSRALAGVVRLNPQAAFTCGLLHAFGELAMQLAMPQILEPINATVGPLDLRRAAAEHHALGYCYAEVGAGFALQWRFPQPMIEALRHQYAPFENNVYEPLAGVIHLAAWRARGKEANLNERGLAVTFPGTVGVALGLDIDMVLQQDPFDWAAHQ